MSDPSNSMKLDVVGVLRNGRRRYDPVSKQRLVEACRQPGASLAGLALRHGVNANLLRKWVGGQPRQQRPGTAVGVSDRATEVFVPVVELGGGVADLAASPAPSSIRHPVPPAKAARNGDSAGPRLTVEMPNGVTLRLECSGQDAELVSAMIVTLGRCDVPAGR
jgi:transposase